jgi:polyisoprenoid-binding protein YceI
MFRKGVVVVFAGLLTLAAAVAQAADTYHVDRVHSAVTFKIRHIVSKVPGKFNDFDGAIVLDRNDMTKSSVEFTVKTASIDTDNEKRDEHLRSDAFFDVQKHPEMTFKSAAVTKMGENKYDVTGTFTLHDTTRTITIPVEVLGVSTDNSKIGFETSFTLNRQEYGVKWNNAMEGGGLILGDDVDITINIEASLPREKK